MPCLSKRCLLCSPTSAVAVALSKRRPCLLAFYSSACGLCRAMEPTLAEVSLFSAVAQPSPARGKRSHCRADCCRLIQAEMHEADWLETARINTDDQLAWAPEVLSPADLPVNARAVLHSTEHLSFLPT